MFDFFSNENVGSYVIAKFKNNLESLFYSFDISFNKNPHRYSDNLRINKRIRKYFNNYMSNKKISEEKKIVLMNCIIFNLENNEECKKMADEIYGKILNSGRKLSFAEIIFVIQYTTYLKYYDIKYDKKTKKVKEGYEDFELPNLFLEASHPNNNVYANHNQKEGISFFYKNFLYKYVNFNNKKNSKKIELPFELLLDLIRIINHEMIHHQQHYESSHNFLTESSFNYIKYTIFRETSSTEHRDEYHINYRFKEIEVEANITGVEDAIRIAQKYAPELTKELQSVISNRENLITQQAISFQLPNRGPALLTEEYNAKHLIYSVKKDPQWLKRYPQLQFFFNLDGSLKSEEELLREYSNFEKRSNEKSLDLFDEIFTYLYGVEHKTLNVDLPDDLIQVKIRIISKLLKKEAQNVDIVSYLKISHPEFVPSFYITIIQKREERIMKYLSYLSNVKNHLMRHNKNEEEVAKIDDLIELSNDLLTINHLMKKNISHSHNKKNTEYYSNQFNNNEETKINDESVQVDNESNSNKRGVK